MKKQEYVKPTMKTVTLQHQSHLLAGSITSVKTNGLDDDLDYDAGGGDQGSAW